jgi:hypothetical protein
LYGGLAEEFANLDLMEQEAANRFGLVVKVAGLFVGLNVEVIEPGLVVLDAGEGVGEVALASSDRFYFRSAQDKPGLIGIQDLVIPMGFSIGDDWFWLTHR